MSEMREQEKSCGNCVHRDLPGTSTICRSCRGHQGGWMNWRRAEKPAQGKAGR